MTSSTPYNVTVRVPVSELYRAVRDEQLDELQALLDGIDLGHVDVVSQCHLLHTAASCDQVTIVRLLITKYNWPVDCKNEDEQTPLHLACDNDCLNVIRMLVMEYKADLNARDKHNDTPLHVAARCRNNNMDAIKYLMDELNCNPSTTGCKGRTILHYACYGGHTKLVKMLLTEYHMNPLYDDNNGNTALHYAVQSGREEIVRIFATNYYDFHMSCRNKHAQSPLDVACSNGYLHIARLFVIKHGLKKTHDDNLLCIAARYGQTNTVCCLIDEFGYNPNIKGRDGMTILQLACHEGQLEVIEMVLTRYCNRLRVSLGDNNNTLLHYAILNGQKNVIKLLLTKHYFPIDCLNGSKESPLHIACTTDHIDIVRMLVTEYSADLNARDNSISNPLHKAAIHGQTAVVDVLIKEFGCDPISKGFKGATILHYSCHHGHLEQMKKLLSVYKLDPMCFDNDESTPLHYAALAGRETVAKLLICVYGCPVDCRNNRNQTPLYLACVNGHLNFVRMLISEFKADKNALIDLHITATHKRMSSYTKVNSGNSSGPKQSLLHLACSSGHLDMVKMLVSEYEADLYARDENNDTPLHRAANCGHFHIVNSVIKDLKYNPNTKGNKGRTILHHACCKGHAKLVETLVIDHNLDPLCVDDDGNTLVHLAAMGGKETVIELLIIKYGCPVDRGNNIKQSPLHLACKYGHIYIVRMLLSEYKADLFIRDINNKTPLHMAKQNDVIEYLSSRNVKDGDGFNLLHFACEEGLFELVVRLVAFHQYNPRTGDYNGNSPLHYAALGGHIEVIKLLIPRHYTTVDPLNCNFETPLHLACTKGHIMVIQMLVTEYNADINAFDINNHTPLQRAVISGQAEMVDYFIKEFNCSVDIKGPSGSNLLHFACKHGHLELIERLIKDYGFDPIIADDNGNTPLHYAALADKSEVATLLIIEHGSHMNQLNNCNETPLHLACSEGHQTVTQTLIIEHKADVNACDINNHTPLQSAALSGQTEVVCLLILDFSCDRNITGIRGRNLLHYACLNDHDVLAKKLIDSFNFSLISADIDGNSPLHISAMSGQYKCIDMLLHIYHAPVFLRNNSGKSALEIARDMGTKMMIDAYLKEEHDRIQYDYKEVQNLSKMKYSGAQRFTRIFVLGNVKSGKSTLIESLKRQGFFSSFNQVSEAIVPPHTSGIIPSEYRHKSIGRVVYYDFAGDPEYYSSHSAIMSSVMQAKEGTNVCLVLINFQKDNEHILEELGYWFSFISYHCTKLKERCKILAIASHADLITKHDARRKIALVSEFVERYLSHSSNSSIEVVKSKSDLIINCCRPRSSACVHSTLNHIVRKASICHLSEEAAILLGLLEKDFKNVVTCKIQTLLAHIMETGVYLPNTADSIYPKIMELHTVGLLLVIESMSGKVEDYLLLLNISKLTNEVHKLLFSKNSTQSFLSSTESDLCSANMGILPQTYLASILPEYVTTECLVQLQYCQEFSHAEVKLDYSVITTKDFCAPQLLYFPALCGTERRKSIITPEFYDYSIGWYIRCCGKFDYLPPRFLHVFLLRLAHTFALPAAHEQPSSPAAEGNDASTLQLYNRRCTMWKNGIHWLMEEGVECYVEMVNNSKGVVIVAKSESVHISTCTEMLFKIIQEIHQAKEEFCGTVTLQEYLMDSDNPAAFTNEDILFATCDIARVLQKGNPYVVSTSGRGHAQLKAARISYLIKYVHWGKHKYISYHAWTSYINLI